MLKNLVSLVDSERFVYRLFVSFCVMQKAKTKSSQEKI